MGDVFCDNYPGQKSIHPAAMRLDIRARDSSGNRKGIIFWNTVTFRIICRFDSFQQS